MPGRSSPGWSSRDVVVVRPAGCAVLSWLRCRLTVSELLGAGRRSIIHRTARASEVAVVLALHAALAAADPDAACPSTTAEDPLFGTSIPGWYGTEALAVQLSSPARWSTTQPGFLIGEKLFWRSSGFRPGTESSLKISIENLNGGPVTGNISEATNAYIPSAQLGRPLTDAEARSLIGETAISPDGWRMLTGIDFPEPGCWEISASYLGQTLRFVVETVNSNEDSDSAPSR